MIPLQKEKTWSNISDFVKLPISLQYYLVSQIKCNCCKNSKFINHGKVQIRIDESVFNTRHALTFYGSVGKISTFTVPRNSKFRNISECLIIKAAADAYSIFRNQLKCKELVDNDDTL